MPLDNELFGGTAGTPGGTNGVPGPYGLGVRVPMIVISPWSKGGWVNSQVFDHTSLIRFIEQRFDVIESQWNFATRRGNEIQPPLCEIGRLFYSFRAVASRHRTCSMRRALGGVRGWRVGAPLPEFYRR